MVPKYASVPHPLKKGKGNPEMVKRRPKLRTAHDVIHRVMWDPCLEKEDFVVGYLDRFIGVIERPFSSFNFTDDIATFDIQEAFAIPQHRVQYIKYKGEVAWDKNLQIDNVFGSSGGSAMKIAQFQEYVDNMLTKKAEQKDKEDKINADNTSTVTSTTTTKVSAAQLHSCESSASLKPSPKRVFKNNDRPNYFLCIRVFDKRAQTRAGQLQNSVRMHLSNSFKEAGTEIESALPSTKLMHITMLVLKLSTPDDVQRAAKHLESFSLEYPSGLHIPLVGAHNFRDGRVVYTQPEPGHQSTLLLHKLQAKLRDHMTLLGNGIVKDEGGRSWCPHVTITKMGRSQCRALGNNAGVPESAYGEFLNVKFGSTRVLGVHLCPMGRPEPGKFYPVASTVWNTSPYVQKLFDTESIMKQARDTIRLAKSTGKLTDVEKLQDLYGVLKDYLECGEAVSVTESYSSSCSVEEGSQEESKNCSAASFPNKVSSTQECQSTIQSLSIQKSDEQSLSIQKSDEQSSTTQDSCQVKFTKEDVVFKAFALLRQTAHIRYSWNTEKNTIATSDLNQLCTEAIESARRNKTLIVLRGIPGSGKSTICSELYQRWKSIGSSIVCSADDFFAKWKFEFSNDLLPMAHNYCAGIILDALKSKTQLVLVDNTHIHRWEYADTLMVAAAAGYTVKICEIECPNQDYAIRFGSRNTHSVPKGKVVDMFSRFEHEPATSLKLVTPTEIPKTVTQRMRGTKEQLYIFDFDATLFDTPSMEVFNRVTQSKWKAVRPASGPKSFIMSPLSLTGAMRAQIRVGPAYSIMKKLLSTGHKVAVVTGRATSLSSHVLSILTDNDMIPNQGLITKPNNYRGTTPEFKKEIVRNLIDGMIAQDPSIKLLGLDVHFVDDLEQNCLAVMNQSLAEFVDLYVHGPSSDVFKSVLGNTFTSVQRRTGLQFHPSLSEFSGKLQFHVQQETSEAIVSKVQHIVSKWWTAVSKQKNTDFEWNQPELVFAFGSSAIGRQTSDIDVCVVTNVPNNSTNVEPSDACAELQKYLMNKTPVFEAQHSGRSSCPRVKFKLPVAVLGIDSSRSVHVDVIFLFVQEMDITGPVCVQNDWNHYRTHLALVTRSIRYWDSPSVRALSGIQSTERCLSNMKESGLGASEFINLLDSLLYVLRRRGVAMRTFQATNWLSCFLEFKGHSVANQPRDLFREFLNYAIHEMSDETWTVVKHGYSDCRIPLISNEHGFEMLEILRSVAQEVQIGNWEGVFLL